MPTLQLRSSADNPASGAPGNPSAERQRVSARRRAFAVVAVLLLALGLYAGLSWASPPPSATVTSTHFSVTPAAVLASAAAGNPAGFVTESSKRNVLDGGLQGGDWFLLSNADGSVANLTVSFFGSMNSSIAYYNSLVGGVRGLPGYSDISSALSSYTKFGGCYAYGEDVDGIAVANGICSKGNLALQVHLASSVPFTQLEDDLTSLMGSLYNAVV